MRALSTRLRNPIIMSEFLTHPVQIPPSYFWNLRRQKPKVRRGAALALFAVLLPALFGLLMVVIDGSLLMSTHRSVQHVNDMAAEAAAYDLYQGKSTSIVTATAVAFVKQFNDHADATVSVRIPPATGPYAGRSGYVEVEVVCPSPTYFLHLFGTNTVQNVRTTAVAGSEVATAGAAIVVLDPTPPVTTIAPLSIVTLTIPPLRTAGLEVLGLGPVKIDGAVLVNTEWGGVDQDSCPTGTTHGPPYGVAGMPLLPLTQLKARDVRVVGGVDRPSNFSAFASGQSPPLKAGRKPVPDPLQSLPAPIVGSDSSIDATSNGGVSVTGLPIIGPTRHLYPGVYDWIQVLSGKAVFHPGVYIIRSKHPVTQLSLSIAAGQVTATGVMFYITDSPAYTPNSGLPDSQDGETNPGNLSVTTLVPSVVISTALLGSQITPLADAGSPFNGLLIYQRRTDRRPIVIAGLDLLNTATLSGTIYAKWGEVIFASEGTYNMRFVVGTMRFVNVLTTNITPSSLLPAARDVFLVE